MSNYQSVVAAVKEAVSVSVKGEAKWLNVGSLVAEQWSSEEQLLAVKVQFCADAIVPALKPEHQKALSTDIPRKGTKGDLEAPEQWEAMRATRKTATAYRDTYFANVLKYAKRIWNPEGAAEGEGEDAPKATDSDKFRKNLAALIDGVQKKEGLDFDIAAVVAALKVAQTKAQPKN